MRRVLVISNGHGEIAIAERIAATVLARASSYRGLEPFALDHLPLVGVGRALPGFPVVGPREAMPSGGLVAMGNVRAFAGDLAAGFARLFARQVSMVRRVRYDGVVAVGDVYALGFAMLVRAPREPFGGVDPGAAPAIFVGTAKSVSVAPYGPGERKLLGRARRVFVRDVATAQTLVRHGIPAEAPGNVIVDMIDPPAGGGASPAPGDPPAGGGASPAPGAPPAGGGASPAPGVSKPWIAVLPGSRERAYDDALRLLAVLRTAAAAGVRPSPVAADAPLEVLCSVAPGLSASRFAAALASDGWAIDADVEPLAEAFVARAPGIRVTGWRGPLGDVLAGATIALGQAGTANEQAAAAGVPVVALGSRRVAGARGGGEGWYRMRQQRLLGDGLALIPPAPEAAAPALAELLRDTARLARMGAAGRERMGGPGGAAAIADAILGDLLSRPRGPAS